MPLRAAVLLLCICSHAGVHMRLFAQAPMYGHVLRAIDQESRQNAMGYEWLRWSSEHIGHRLTGSINGSRAEALADSLFRASGLVSVSSFAFSAHVWSRGTIDLGVASGDTIGALRAVCLANTPELCDVELVLVDAGNGLRRDLDSLGEALRGKAVLINLGLLNAPAGSANLHRSEKTALAMERGAAGVVFVNNVEGHVLLTGTASINGEPIAIPAVCIASEDGARLREQLSADEGVRVHLHTTNHYALVEAHNVIAEIPGKELADEVIIVGGHLDSWDLATGATDNGLGSFSILDMARCFRALGIQPKRTIRFVLFMGEEQGLLGSRALVDHYRANDGLRGIRCMINMDMSGNPRGFNAGGPPAWRALIDSINSRINSIDSTYLAKSSDGLGLHSDHQPFLLAGVPVIGPICDLGSQVYRCYHSDCDDMHLVDAQAMVNNVRFVGMLIYELAMAGKLPPAFTEEQLRARLITDGLEEPLRVGGDWPW